MLGFFTSVCNVSIEQLRESLWETEDKRIRELFLFTFLIFDMFISAWKNKFPQFKIDWVLSLLRASLVVEGHHVSVYWEMVHGWLLLEEFLLSCFNCSEKMHCYKCCRASIPNTITNERKRLYI